MSMADFKLYVINSITLGVTTLTNLEMTLKILLLLVTIGYTASRWWNLHKHKK